MKKIIIFYFFLFSQSKIFSQNIGINATGAAPHTSAMLDVSSTSKGLLIPRMTSAQRIAIATPGTGLLVYDTDNNNFWYYNGAAWSQLSVGSNGWNLTGNSATNPATHFIGTTDNQPLRFRVNNLWAGEIHPTSGNIFLGLAAGQGNTTGFANTALGVSALPMNTSSSYNVAIGDSTLFSQTGTVGGNTAIGSHTLYSNVSGANNAALGAFSLYNNTIGDFNTAIGLNSLYNNIAGSENTAVGSRALQFNVLGFNTAVGASALRFNTVGYFNTANGYQSLYSNTTGSDNIAIGASALVSQSFNNSGVTYSSRNVAIGNYALFTNNPTSITNGVDNTAIGDNSLQGNTTGYENTGIGSGALYNNSTGISNTATGYYSLFANTTGSYNVAYGQGALYANNGNYNTASGYGSLGLNTTGTNNTATGYYSLSTNTLGTDNIALGSYTLSSNKTGSYNTATGSNTLPQNTTGFGNTATGFQAVFANTTGLYNTGVGYFALSNNISGDGNTALGYASGPNAGILSNTTCIGNGATAIGNNQVVLGNANVTQFYSYGAFVGTTALAPNLAVLATGQIARSTSSRRYKKDIIPIDINTANIYKLNPVSYNSYTDNERHFGLIAEEVAEVIPELAFFTKEKDVIKGSTSETMIPDAVQYPLLSVLLLKEVQKHEQTINQLQATIDEMKKMMAAQQSQIDALKK